MTNITGTGVTPVAVVFDDGSEDSWSEELGFLASDEERAFARELVLEHLAELVDQEAIAEANGWGPVAGCEVDPFTDDELVVGLAGPVHESDLLLLASIHPDALESNAARLAFVAAADRVAALVAGLRCEALVAFAGEEPTGDYLVEVAGEHEVAVARRSSRYAAGRDIEVARSLRTTFPRFGLALLAGEVSEGHCRALVERTRVVTDPAVLVAIESRVLRKAKRLPVGKFGDEVAKAITALDAYAIARHRRAKDSRCVYSRPLPDGLGFMGIVDDWGTISALRATIDADAQVLRAERGGAAAVPEDDDARVGACRADALAARVLGTVDEDGTVTWEPRDSVQVTLDLVIDLTTLRGEDDRLALLEGQPVPAQIAREWVDAVRTWRRVVTDPVDGHLLDYGTRQYLPDRLRRYVLARDGGCIAPDCSTRSRRRLQLDHVVEFPDGPSSAANTDCKCVVCHQLKTAGHITITDSNADGSRTWTTASGQTVRIPPRPFLHDPVDDPPPRRRQTPHTAPEPQPALSPTTPAPADQDEIRLSDAASGARPPGRCEGRVASENLGRRVRSATCLGEPRAPAAPRCARRRNPSGCRGRLRSRRRRPTRLLGPRRAGRSGRPRPGAR